MAVSAGTQPHAGAQEFLGIDRVAVDPGFVVQMRTGRSAGRADGADHLSDLDLIANLDADLRQMSVTGRQAVAVIDFDHAAVAASPSRRDHFSVRGRPHRVAHGGAEIEPGVHGGAAEEWIAADSEAGSEFDFAHHRFAIRHQCQGAVETLDLAAGDVDPVKLALESAGVGSKFDWNEGAADASAFERQLYRINI